jgi:pimeloyl-ACP methyl ester carboxylesterase
MCSRILFTFAASLACAQSSAQRSATPHPRWPSQEGFVTADDGIRLYYSVEGEGPQTVIVPAALYLQRDLRELAKGRRIVFYDMRGRGRSDRVDDTTHITIQWDVRDMESVRRHMNAQRMVPVGFSYLGLMVMLYAAEHPDRVERIVQIGSVPRRWDTRYPPELTANDPTPVPDSAARAELSALRRSQLAVRDPQAHCVRERELTRVGLVGDAHLAERVPNVCEFPNEWPAAFRRHLGYHFVGSVQRLDVPWETFQRVTVPVLTVHGTKDRNAPYGGGREWATRLPNARLLTVPGAAHLPWIDQPAQVLGAIETFLSGAWPISAERVRPDQ